jgi:hypothetical protein
MLYRIICKAAAGFDRRTNYILHTRAHNQIIPTMYPSFICVRMYVGSTRDTHPLEGDMLMIRIQALEWVQGRIQDIILNNVTRDWPVYNK